MVADEVYDGKATFDLSEKELLLSSIWGFVARYSMCQNDAFELSTVHCRVLIVSMPWGNTLLKAG